MELLQLNGGKSKRILEKTRQVKFKKYILRGLRSVRYYERILSNKKKSYNFSQKNNFSFIRLS